MFPISAWIALLWITLLVGVWSFIYLFGTKRSKGRLPPGPPGIPILGNLLMLGDLPHQALYKLAMKYGPIMHIRLGLVPAVIVSSPQAAQQFLKKHDLVFASRPITEVGKYISYNCKGLAFSPYGTYWRNVRKLCTLELLSNLKIESFRSMRKEELSLLVETLMDSARAHTAVDVSAKVASFYLQMTCRMVFGRKYMEENLDNRGFKAVVNELLVLIGSFNAAEYIPFAGALDVQGIRRRMKAINKVFSDFFDKIIDEHLQDREIRHQKDFVDFMLSFMESNNNEFQIDRTNIKAIILEMLVGATDTSATVIEWALSELIKHPRVLKKVQEELDSVVGMDRMVEESDLTNLEYLDMVVKETMRLHPVLPLLVPHEAMEDCMVNDFYIPKNSRVIINAWAIGRDPNAWPNAGEFYPERFIGASIDVKGHDFQLLPFGSGRRGCPGMQLGVTVVRLAVAQLIHCFDWELPNGVRPDDLDMSERFSLVIPRANSLLAIPTYRLRLKQQFVN
ncbi:cytochrome P450 71AU50-like [Magnolia sinica]|uniref:cytochrome P450 71AU50-like n=1 Tax=Magnolia sinica TaxID=86752 RepID=UPI0026580A22|nr:cytochrome P450 71AU50-like [Magnolia sinica]